MRQGALVNLLIGIFIVLLPLYTRVCAFDVGRATKDNLFLITIGAFCLLLPNAQRKLSKTMVFSVVYGLFFVVFNNSNPASINVMYQSFMIAGGICFLISFYQKFDSESVGLILYGMAVGCILQSIMAIYGYYGVDIYQFILRLFNEGSITINMAGRDNGPIKTIGSLGNSNMLASYVAITSMSFFYFKHKWLLILPMITLYLNGSDMGQAAFVGGVLYYANCKLGLVKKAYVYIVTIVAMLTAPFVFAGLGSGRFQFWINLLKEVSVKHWLIGSGAGWFPDQKFLLFKDNVILQEHNAFLSFFNVFGLLGFLVIAPIFYKFITSKDKNIVFASILFTAFCNSYGHFSSHQSTVAIIIIVVTAICLAEGKNNGINVERDGLTS